MLSLIVSLMPTIVIGILFAMVIFAVFFLIDAHRDITFYLLIVMISTTFVGCLINFYLIQTNQTDLMAKPWIYTHSRIFMVAAWLFAFGCSLQGIFLRSYRKQVSLAKALLLMSPFFIISALLYLLTVYHFSYLRYLVSAMLGGYIAGNIAYESKFLLKTESSKLLKFIYFFSLATMLYALARAPIIVADYLFFTYTPHSILDMDQFFISNRILMFFINVFSESVLLIFWVQSRSRMAYEKRQNIQEVYKLLHERETLIDRMSKNKTLVEAGAFSAGMAHELNQYLARIELNTEKAIIIAAERGVFTEIEPIMAKIKNANASAAFLILQMKSLFKSSEVQVALCNPDTIVLEAIDLVAEHARRSDITIYSSLTVNSDVELWRPIFHQLIINLLMNAIESLDETEGRSKRIQIETSISEGQFILNVIDNGKGVSGELNDEVFSLFTTDKPYGTGIGLWFCKHVADKHYGKIEFRNLLINGAHFKVTIPAYHPKIDA